MDNIYQKPYNIDEIKRKFDSDLANQLLNDPVHKWRAETGIELIHKEPDLNELERIWVNWNLMNENDKKISDEKSLELFGVNNQENFEKLKLQYKER